MEYLYLCYEQFINDMLVDPIEIYKQMNLFSQENGMVLTVKKPGESHYKMTILSKHLSSPNTCHGGVIAGFMDAIIGAAALSLAFTQNNLVSTVEFKINYFKPVHLGHVLRGEGKVDFEGKSIISSSGEIFNETTGELVAKAMGTFNIYPLSKRKDFSDMFGL